MQSKRSANKLNQRNYPDLISKEQIWDRILDNRALIFFWRSPFVQNYKPINWLKIIEGIKIK